ncbi:MAG: hypothetical protein P4L35_12460 [Ignavibacteriaceae bacterium]|nr:hypothetical protein [Ignavibacteriaceae bacterium]
MKRYLSKLIQNNQRGQTTNNDLLSGISMANTHALPDSLNHLQTISYL